MSHSRANSLQAKQEHVPCRLIESPPRAAATEGADPTRNRAGPLAPPYHGFVLHTVPRSQPNAQRFFRKSPAVPAEAVGWWLAFNAAVHASPRARLGGRLPAPRHDASTASVPHTCLRTAEVRVVALVIRHSFVIRHWAFAIPSGTHGGPYGRFLTCSPDPLFTCSRGRQAAPRAHLKFGGSRVPRAACLPVLTTPGPRETLAGKPPVAPITCGGATIHEMHPFLTGASRCD